jgi:hypothetical protein|tara:strand:- start:90 stop:299 length:210 start_codon:yes stop_codon:yes gene_type:complete
MTNYKCPKCNHLEADTGKIRTTGDGASRYMNVQNQKFGYTACMNCGFTEFYRDSGKDKGWKTVLDALSN